MCVCSFEKLNLKELIELRKKITSLIHNKRKTQVYIGTTKNNILYNHEKTMRDYVYCFIPVHNRYKSQEYLWKMVRIYNIQSLSTRINILAEVLWKEDDEILVKIVQSKFFQANGFIPDDNILKISKMGLDDMNILKINEVYRMFVKFSFRKNENMEFQPCTKFMKGN